MPHVNRALPEGLRAVVFDLDGVLLDTEPIYLAATEELLARYGRRLDKTVWWAQIGRPSPTVAANIASAHAVGVSGSQFHAEREELLAARLARAALMPGAAELVERLRAHRVPVAFATSSSRETFALKSGAHGSLFEGFDHLVTRDDVTAGKPAPDLYLRAAELLGVPPAQCLAFEDAPSGITSAVAAGMHVVAVPSVPLPVDLPEAVVQVVDSLAAFDAAPLLGAWAARPDGGPAEAS